MENGFMGGALIGLFITAAIIFIGFYIYASLALMTIAKRTKTKDAWLAWIPIANIYLMMKIGRLPTWTLALWALIFVPMLGGLAGAGMTIWSWWAIAEQRGKDGWWGILMLVPLLNLVLIGILAWGADDKKPTAPSVAKIAKKKAPAKKTPVKKKVVKKK